MMCIVVKTQEGPVIVICLREGAIHSALALPNAPCRQGVDVTESGHCSKGSPGSLQRDSTHLHYDSTHLCSSLHNSPLMTPTVYVLSCM